ncbi:MAG: DUF4920 domain-containing protein [Acidobacteria bacterium]|nr:DUF4920 domain-containing protein [Acidobacteriota bacterium]
MRRKLISAFILLALASAAGEKKLGKELTLKTQTPIPDLLASADQHTGKTVQVKGKITEVCQMMGCWTNLVDPASGKMMRVKVNDGEIVFPKEAIGKMAVAEGVLQKIELTKEQAIARARHEAEEQSRKFNPASVKSGAVIYQIQGTGAILLD